MVAQLGSFLLQSAELRGETGPYSCGGEILAPLVYKTQLINALTLFKLNVLFSFQ